MMILITEENGIKHQPYGHMKKGETREVSDDDGRFFCANGWARDTKGIVETGKRGSLDNIDPKKWIEENPA